MAEPYRVRILHLSDLHARVSLDWMTKKRKLLIRSQKPARERVIGTTLEKELADVVTEAPVDLVCFTGDVADWGLEPEYSQAGGVFTRILSVLKLDASRFFVVPGNHDVSRKTEEAAWTEMRKLLADREDVAHGLGAWAIGSRVPSGVDADLISRILRRLDPYWTWIKDGQGRKDLLPGDPAEVNHPTLGFRASLKFESLPFPVHIVGLNSAWLCGDDHDKGYLMGRKEGGSFDQGIEAALQRILADLEFVYRGEAEPVGITAGQPYRISDLALASRLSFFLWSSVPDDELIDLATQGKLRNPTVLEQQVRRMLKDSRSEALINNFTGQWLSVRSLKTSEPVVNLFPDFDDNLRNAFQREIELFFGSIVHDDRSVLDLLDADYTFVNERLAKHYGIPNLYGPQFRRVTLGQQLDMRRGLLGKGALLTVTSQAARTSPVTRGKWFLETFLGVSPPQPPPDVDTTLKIAPTDPAGNTKTPSMRQILEAHRTNPTCSTCHRIFEPMGFALENFDAVGAWRTHEDGVPIDASGVLVDGTKIDNVAGLRDSLKLRSDTFAQVVTEKLLTYALGRGVEHQDMPLVRSIVRDATASKYRFSSLVLNIVKSAAFQMNMKVSDVRAQQQAARQ